MSSLMLNLKALFSAKSVKAGFAAFLACMQLLGAVLFSLPHDPLGEKLDLSKFELTWSDEFDGSKIDDSKWKAHYAWGDDASVRRGGWFHKSLAEVKDGKLFINVKYLENGVGNGPAGYYSYLMDTHGLFEQKYGYFEVSCKLPKGEGLWAAFWMLSDGMFNVDGTGKDGAEIDIFESPNYVSKLARNSVCSNIHYDGYNDAHKSDGIGDINVPEPYDSFNTYGVEWNEKEYIFYINGVESDRLSFGGASQVPEYLILSVEVDGDNGVPSSGWSGDIRNNEFLPTAFEVEYVRAYQYK